MGLLSFLGLREDYNDRLPDLDEKDLAHYRTNIRENSEIHNCILCGKTYRHYHAFSDPRPHKCKRCEC